MLISNDGTYLRKKTRQILEAEAVYAQERNFGRTVLTG
jgi:hypothetical protein